MRQEDCFCYKILIDEYISGHIAMSFVKGIAAASRKYMRLKTIKIFCCGSLNMCAEMFP